jgi:hypothetical protein
VSRCRAFRPEDFLLEEFWKPFLGGEMQDITIRSDKRMTVRVGENKEWRQISLVMSKEAEREGDA